MIDHFRTCMGASCKDPTRSEDNEGITALIKAAHPRYTAFDLLFARFKDQDDADRYCKTRHLTPGSDSCKVIGYSIQIIRVRERIHPNSEQNSVVSPALVKTTYYSFYKICPPPPSCR